MRAEHGKKGLIQQLISVGRGMTDRFKGTVYSEELLKMLKIDYIKF